MKTSGPMADAVSRLYAEYQPWLLGRVRRQLPCLADAEDVTADTFVQVIQRSDLAAIREPQAFLTVIARRLMWRLFRRRQLEAAYLARLQQLPAARAPSPEDQLIVLQTIQSLDAWMQGLPVPVRLAFLYSTVDELDHETIAARLGVSVRTVGRYVQRALLHYLAARADAGSGQAAARQAGGVR
ncbi:hypothetical protein GCM10023144_35520 [Pigmentiphaga soli]|uniref:Sigma-70 family RNA polymerase sigma factor n=1 Tax=Pigmentiphaga soli TaxID=1007095 RepID=A0ABP8HEY1_9BURK